MGKFGGWTIHLICTFTGLVVQKISSNSEQIPDLFSFMGVMVQFPYSVTRVGIRRPSEQIITHRISVTLFSLTIVGVLLLQLG